MGRLYSCRSSSSFTMDSHLDNSSASSSLLLDSPFEPSSSRQTSPSPPTAHYPRHTSQSRSSSSSTLIPMQSSAVLVPIAPNAVVVDNSTILPAAANFVFPRTISEPSFSNRPISRTTSTSDLVVFSVTSQPTPPEPSPSGEGDSRPPASPSSSPSKHNPERRPSLQDRRKLQQQAVGEVQVGGLMLGVSTGLVGGEEAQESGSPIETPLASRESFLTDDAGRRASSVTQVARPPTFLDRTPRPSPTAPSSSPVVDQSPLAADEILGQVDSTIAQPSRQSSGGRIETSSTRSESWDSTIPEATPWSRFHLPFQNARPKDAFSQSASVGSTHVTTPDSEDPHHSQSPHHPYAQSHSTRGSTPSSQSYHSHYSPSHLGHRTSSQVSLGLPSTGTFTTDGLPVFSPSPFFKEVVLAHTVDHRSASAIPFDSALSQSPPHRMDMSALFAHYQSAAAVGPSAKPTKAEGFFDHGPNVGSGGKATTGPRPTLRERERSYDGPETGGGKGRNAVVDVTLGSSAFAPGLRKRLEEIMEKVSRELDWEKAGGEGVVTIVEYSAMQGNSKDLVCPILIELNSRLSPASQGSQFMVYHQSTQEDLRHASSLYAEGSYLSPTFLAAQHPTLKDRVFSYVVSRSFSAVMAPPRTVHLGFTVLDLQWLHSPRPSTLSISAAADRELRDFLAARSREFRPEGVLVMAFVMSNNKQPRRSGHPTSSASSPQSSSFRFLNHGDPGVNGSFPYPSNEPSQGERGRSGSLSSSPPLAASSDVWRQIASVLSVCVTRLVSIGSIRSAIAPLLTSSLLLWPRSSAELRRTLAHGEVASKWKVVLSHGLTDEDDASFPDDDGPFSMVHPAYRALVSGTLSSVSYAEHAVSFVKIIYEAHFRAVLLEKAGMTRGATEMTLHALFCILTEKCEEGCLDGLALDFGIIALRRV